jgi:hypothetical protein
MPFPDIAINEFRFPVKEYQFNQLLPEVCKENGLVFVHLDTIHTQPFSYIKGMKDISPDGTYAFCFFSSQKICIENPILFSVGMRLRTQERVIICDTFVYEPKIYHFRADPLTLNSEPGCTETYRMGLYLLKQAHGRLPTQIGVLSVWSGKCDDLDRLPIANTRITQICNEDGIPG